MVLSGAFESMGGTACFDTTTMPLIDSLSPRRRSGERVRERGFQLAAPIRWKVPLSLALSPLVPRREGERRTSRNFRTGPGYQHHRGRLFMSGLDQNRTNC